MKKNQLIVSLLAPALLAVSFGSWAQEDERAALSDVWLVQPKKGMVMQFEEAARSHLAFRRDAGDTREWTGYGTALGNNPTLYQWRAGGLGWADQDAYIAEDRENGYTDHWFANVDQYVDHYHHFLETADYANSNWPEDLGQHPYYGVTTWKSDTPFGPDMQAARKELSRIGKEGGWAEAGNHWLWLSRTGGGHAIMVVTEFDSFADMAPPDQSFFAAVAEHLGSPEQAQELFGRFLSDFTSTTYTVWQHRPDLSSSSEMVGRND